MLQKYIKVNAFALVFLALLCQLSYAQNVGINSTGAAPAASAGLDVNFTDKGFLAPRMTLAQRTAISSPATGLLVYQTDAPAGFYYYNGSGWSYLTTSGTSAWALVGNTGQVAAAYNTGSFIGNQDNNHLRFRTSNTQRMFIHSSNGGVAIGANPTFATNVEKLLVDAGTTTSYNLISGKGSYNNYLQLNIQNTSSGTAASSDVVASNNAATESANFIDMGINSSGYSSTGILGGANAAYLYSTGSDLAIGNASAGNNLKFFTNGTANTDERMRITSTGLVGIGTTTPVEKLDVNGNAIIGTDGTSGRVKITNTAESGITDIFTADNTMLRISNNGMGQTGSSLQLKNGDEKFLFSFEGRGGFRYYSRTTGNIGEKFRVNDEGDIYLTTTGENTAVDGQGNINDFYQLNVMNQNSGNNASSDVVATADNGDDTDAYIDMGINSSGYNSAVNGVGNILNGPNVTYLYGNGEKMFVGNASRNKDLAFFTNSSSQDGGEDARGTERMTIKATGEVCIGVTTPYTYNWGFSKYKFSLNGRACGDAWDTPSDRRLKNNIQNLTYGLKEVMSLSPVKYNWTDSTKIGDQLGLIAQDVKKVIPEVVRGDESSEYLRMNYTELVPVLINAIKEQQAQIEELKKKVEVLQNK